MFYRHKDSHKQRNKWFIHTIRILMSHVWTLWLFCTNSQVVCSLWVRSIREENDVDRLSSHINPSVARYFSGWTHSIVPLAWIKSPPSRECVDVFSFKPKFDQIRCLTSIEICALFAASASLSKGSSSTNASFETTSEKIISVAAHLTMIRVKVDTLPDWFNWFLITKRSFIRLCSFVVRVGGCTIFGSCWAVGRGILWRWWGIKIILAISRALTYIKFIIRCPAHFVSCFSPYVLFAGVHKQVELHAQWEKWQNRPRWQTPLFWKS